MEQERMPFDVKFRPEIEAGKYLVETREGKPARITLWDQQGFYPIVGVINEQGEKKLVEYFIDGRFLSTREDSLDLFLVPNPDYKEPVTEQSSVDWDAFRREAAKDILCALITSDMGGSAEEKSRWSIDAADELIKQLKENKK